MPKVVSDDEMLNNRLVILVDKFTKKTTEACAAKHAETRGISQAEYIREAIKEKNERTLHNPPNVQPPAKVNTGPVEPKVPSALKNPEPKGYAVPPLF